MTESVDGGTTFAEPINLSSNGGQSVSSAMAVGDSGRAVLFWKDDVGGNTRIMAAVIR